jgi:hypothetical protein
MAAAVTFCLAGEFVLQFLGKGSMAQVVTIVLSLVSFATVFINGGYITQNIFRDTSLNKNGIYCPDDGEKVYMELPAQSGDSPI